MASNNNNSAAGSNAGQNVTFPPVPVDCDKCGVQFDAIDDAHYSRCSVCQELFGGGEPANVPTAADTTPVAVAPALRAGYILCHTCRREFRPTDKNNGADCTKCCNRAANEGYNIFAGYGQEMTPQAEGLLRQYHQRLAMPAIAPIATLRRTTFPAAPTFSAQPTMSAPAPRKRAAESENEQITQQNEPTTKRSKTSQQQATTMQNTQTAQAAADTLAIAEQDRLMAESLNLPPSDNEEPTQPSERTAEHPEIVPTNPEQTTQSGGDDGDLTAFLRAHMSD
jgi:hypothetical protein